MKFLDSGELLEAPKLDDIPMLYCARYAVKAAELLSGARYNPGNAWDLGERNTVLAENLRNARDLIRNSRLLIPKRTIVIFYNPLSQFNQNGRIGTHAALYLGTSGSELYFAEQYFSRQKTISLKNLKRKMLSPRQILAPAQN